MTRVLLVDDHELIRQGLALAFEDQMEVVGQAGTVAEAMELFAETTPDVVVTDLRLPDGTGLDLVRSIRASHPATGLVVLTMHAGDQQIFAAMEAGASAFVGKDAPADDVVAAARHAQLSPRTFLCAGLPEAMVRRMTGPQVTEREREVLMLLADGLSAGEIAGQLYMSESTVKTHISSIYTKLGASNRAQALVTAIRMGMLEGFRP
ncbi:response regulator transcription factor [Nocardioides limicola]|uniref:response regulator transcription factor n=1 Tax=Nocardioides limicola TaxID=2803368 RepID=UPI00193C075D|nr:response regulator transcription factor [Nocardioides sp. DJM-14]